MNGYAFGALNELAYHLNQQMAMEQYNATWRNMVSMPAAYADVVCAYCRTMRTSRYKRCDSCGATEAKKL